MMHKSGRARMTCTGCPTLKQLERNSMRTDIKSESFKKTVFCVTCVTSSIGFRAVTDCEVYV